MNPSIDTQQLLKENNPIEAVVRILVQAAHMYEIETYNTPQLIKEGVVNDMFLNIVNRLTPEEQIAILEYIAANGSDKRELIILDQGINVSQLIKYIALNSKKFLIGQAVDHYVIYQMIHDFAEEYAQVYNEFNHA